MANLLEVADLAWRQLFPNPDDETAVSRAEFIATTKNEFAYQQLLMVWKEKSDEGYFEVPSYLLTNVSLDIVNDTADISGLSILRSLPQEVWLQNVGGLGCDCKYVKSTLNLSQLLCDDDSLDDAARTYIVMGKSIYFPKGTHITPLPIIYANNGIGVDGRIEIDDAIAGILRTRLIEIYGGKTGTEDTNQNEI